VAFDDHNFPITGTSVGFSASCGTAGENDCDTGDIARATASCSIFALSGIYDVNAAGANFCKSDCFGRRPT
jgi:hypothetical protein